MEHGGLKDKRKPYNMIWNKYTVRLNAEDEDPVAAVLYDLGIEGLEIEDNAVPSETDTDNPFGDVLPDLPDNDNGAAISFYVEKENDDGTLAERVKEAVLSLGEVIDIDSVSFESTVSDDDDWKDKWKEFFHTFYVGNIKIVPTWEADSENTPDENSDMTLYIDPGMAFGTGSHESTRLIIEQLKENTKPGCRMLDIGTGSGILGIIALKYGAGHVVGTDIDPAAFPPLLENLRNNGIEEKDFTVLDGDLITDEGFRRDVISKGSEDGKYDLICANIIAEILAEITPLVPEMLEDDGVYIMSGILDTKLDMTLDSVKKAGLEVMDVKRMGEWCSVCCGKR